MSRRRYTPPLVLVTQLVLLLGVSSPASALPQAGALHGDVSSTKVQKATRAADLLIGTSRANRISGWDGDDVIKGRGGSDYLAGNADNDTLYGDDGNDTLRGEKGNDALWGGSGVDLLEGHDGKDAIHGEAGDDHIFAGIGDDLVYGEDGDDAISGHWGADQIWGGAGDDIVDAYFDDDVVYGEDGRDTLNGSEGDDLIYGGPGDDNVVPASEKSKNGVSAPGGLLGGPGNDHVFGEDGNDHVSGGDGDDVLDAADGDDELDGGPGTDVLVDGPGDDTITGDEGDDILWVGTGADKVWPEEGDDTVYLFDDGEVDVIRCDDLDTAGQRAKAGSDDRVIYVGLVDPIDVIWPSCESVTTVDSSPVGWPYATSPQTREHPRGEVRQSGAPNPQSASVGLALTGKAPAAVLKPTTWPVPSTATAQDAGSASSAELEDAVIVEINRARASMGLRTIRAFDACNDNLAEQWATHIARTTVLEHREQMEVVRKCDDTWAGETLVRGTGLSPVDMVSLWLNSPPHREILLSPRARRAGVAITRDAMGRAIGVVNLASPR